MKADLSRQTFVKRKHYSGVLMQQGRVQVDADWNEQQAIAQYRSETAARDLIGASGAPIHDAGFAITPSNGAPFTIGAGRLYVDGMLCENDDEVSYAEQHLPVEPPDLSGFLAADELAGGLIYLDAWERHVSALDDEQIREVALGGPDTATRKQVFWQVGLHALDIKTEDPDTLRALVLQHQQLVTTLRTAETGDGEPEKIADLHTELHLLGRQISTITGLECDAAMEGLRAARAGGGMLDARAQPSDRADEPCLASPGAGYTRLENQLYRVEIHTPGSRGTATFKWSRDNGSVVFPISQIEGDQITLYQLGRDEVLGIANGDWVEVVDDAMVLNRAPGPLVRVEDVNPATRVVRVNATLPALSAADARARHVQLRRWDQKGQPADLTEGAVRTRGGFIPLEGGVEVQLTDAEYTSGDYWLIPARTATGSIEWLENVPQFPHGIQRHLCPLALVVSTGDGGLAVVSDCRSLFPPVTEFTGLFYLGGGGQEVMPDPAQPDALLPLPHPLRVGVANGEWPVPGALVRFSIHVGGGTVQGEAGGTDVLTDAQGVATCAWAVDTVTLSQQVVATLVTDEGTAVHLPVYFGATLSVATAVAYDPKGCSPLDGALTVQAAIDRLCVLGFREPGVHIEGLETVEPRDILRNDSDVSIDTLLSGIRIACDTPVQPETINQPTCFVTLDRPLFLDQRQSRIAVGYLPFVLAGEVSVRGRIITWRPRRETVEALREQLPTLIADGDRGILARLRLKGNFIWHQDEAGAPELYLDGEAFGYREGESQTTDLRLPSGDGVRGGDFEMWFWLGGAPTRPDGIGIIPNMKSVVMSRPEVHEAIDLVLERERLQGVLPAGYVAAPDRPFDPERARELLHGLDLPERVIIATSVPTLEAATAMIGQALAEHDMGIEYEQRVADDVVENAARTLASGHRLDMVVGDEEAAAALAAALPGVFDGPFLRF